MTTQKHTPSSNISTAPSAGPVHADAVLAVLRIMLGLVFLWAFLDKTFGLG